MLNSLTTFDLGSKVSSYSSLKYLHHEAEQGSCQGSVPSAFGTLVADEGVLGLYLQKLKWHYGTVQAEERESTDGNRNILIFQSFADEVSPVTRHVGILAITLPLPYTTEEREVTAYLLSKYHL